MLLINADTFITRTSTSYATERPEDSRSYLRSRRLVWCAALSYFLGIAVIWQLSALKYHMPVRKPETRGRLEVIQGPTVV